MIRSARILAAGALAGTPAVAQTTYHVNGACGSDAWTGLSPICADPNGPKRTIRAAMTAAAHDDTVLVADGVYAGLGNTNLSFGGKRLVVRSENGPQSCIIDASGFGRAFAFADLLTPVTAVDGFTIRNGRGQPGGAFWFHHRSDATIRNCIITGNLSTIGGAVYTETDAQPTFLNCTFVGNSAAQGGGFAATQASRPTIINCVFVGNTASVEGGALYIAQGAVPTILNATIAGNTAVERAGGVRLGTGNATIRNSIIWANAAPTAPQAAVGVTGAVAAANLTIGHSIVQGGQPGILLQGSGALNWLAGNLDQDPRLVDPPGGNLRLLAASPAIDAADNTALPAGVLLDRDGNPRFVDDPATANTGVPGGAGGKAVVDMGAFEFRGACYPNCDGSTSPPLLNVNDFVCFQQRFAAQDPYADCDQSTTLNVNDFLCFQSSFAAGCR